MASIDGISSGLDTTSIIKSLMAVERRPLQLAESRAAAQDSKIAAWKDITAKVGALRTATQPLLFATTFQAARTSSTDAAIASASAATGTRAGSVTFRVQQIATAHQVMTGTGVGGTDDLVGAGRVAVGAGLEALGFTAIVPDGLPDEGAYEVRVVDVGNGSFEVTIGDETATVGPSDTEATVAGFRLQIGPGGPIIGTARVYLVETTGTTTVAGLTQSLSVAGAVANAQILNIGTGTSPDNRIVLNSRTTGSEGRLLVGTDGLNAGMAAALADLDTITAVQDAELTIGSGPAAVTVTRSSNSVSDLLGGVTIDLRKAAPDTDVTITVARDTATAVSAVAGWVSAVNATLAAIDTKTAYNAETNTAAALTGSSSARSLRQSITDTLFQTQGGTFASVSQLGISIDRSGRLQLDQAKLEAALRDQPEAVRDFFARSSSTTSADVAYRSVGDTTVSGTYAVDITQLASAARVTGGAFGTLAADELLQVRYRGADVSYQATAGQTVAQVAAGLTAALQGAGIDVTAEVVDDGGQRIRLTGASVGSSDRVEVQSSRGGQPDGTGLAAAADVWESHTGLDVAGTIGGAAATGKGAVLTATDGDPKGLSVSISGSSTGLLGSVTVNQGFGGLVNRVVGAGGHGQKLADGQVEAAEAQKDVFGAQIGAYERRLALTEARLRREFAALEAMMSNLQGQNTVLLQQLNALGTFSS